MDELLLFWETGPTMLRTLLAAILAGSILANVLACEREGRERSLPKPPRLVLLYATCTLNRHYLEPYGQSPGLTPNLARFAASSAVFTNHQTESGLSGPAFASIFAGAQADRHGLFAHPARLDDGLYLVSEAFSDAGFESYYWGHHPMARAGLNYAQGVPDQNVSDALFSHSDPEFTRLLDRLSKDESLRAFVATAFTVTHGPYDVRELRSFLERHPDVAPDLSDAEIERYDRINRENHVPLQIQFEETVRKLGLSDYEVSRMALVMEAAYMSRVEVLDRMFGAVLAEIDKYGLGEESVIVFTADHGETLFEEGRSARWTHSPELLPEVIGVPLMIRAPGAAARTVDSATRSIDVYPTLAGLAGVEVPDGAGVDGVDLSPALLRGEEWPELAARSHGTLRLWSVEPDRIEDIWVSRKAGNMLYRWKGAGSQWSFEVFDVGTSTSLEENLFDPSDPEHREVADDLWDYRQRLIARYRKDNPPKDEANDSSRGTLTKEDEAALRSLGYIE